MHFVVIKNQYVLLFVASCQLSVLKMEPPDFESNDFFKKHFNATDPTITPDTTGDLPRILWTYVSPFLFMAGLSGNVLSLIVLNRPPIRRSGISLALRLIAFFDCIILLMGLTRHWAKYALSYDIRSTSSVICKIHMFVVYSALDSSVWNLAALNAGRLIAVIAPLKANLIFTQRRIWLAAFIITGCAMGLNSHVFWTRGQSYSDSNDKCGFTSPTAEQFWRQFLPYVVLLIYVLGPFTAFSICNTIIIFKVHQELETKTLHKYQQNHDSTMRSLTIMLVAASFTFLLLTTPSIILDFVRATVDDGEKFSKDHAIVNVFCTLALYLNHSLSFYTYLLSGTRFRQEAIAMFCPKFGARRDPHAVMVSVSDRGAPHGELSAEIRRDSCQAKKYDQNRKSLISDYSAQQSRTSECTKDTQTINDNYVTPIQKEHQSKLTAMRSRSLMDSLKYAGRSVQIVVENEPQ